MMSLKASSIRYKQRAFLLCSRASYMSMAIPFCFVTSSLLVACSFPTDGNETTNYPASGLSTAAQDAENMRNLDNAANELIEEGSVESPKPVSDAPTGSDAMQAYEQKQLPLARSLAVAQFASECGLETAAWYAKYRMAANYSLNSDPSFTANRAKLSPDEIAKADAYVKSEAKATYGLNRGDGNLVDSCKAFQDIGPLTMLEADALRLEADMPQGML